MSCCYPGPPRVPTFNLLCNIWYGNPVPPVIAVPTLANVPCQILPGELDFNANIGQNMYIRVAKLTDVHFQRGGMPGGPDIFECPAASGQWYQAHYVFDVGKGFTNEYRVIYCLHLPPYPTPIP